MRYFLVSFAWHSKLDSSWGNGTATLYKDSFPSVREFYNAIQLVMNGKLSIPSATASCIVSIFEFKSKQDYEDFISA